MLYSPSWREGGGVRGKFVHDSFWRNYLMQHNKAFTTWLREKYIESKYENIAILSGELATPRRIWDFHVYSRFFKLPFSSSQSLIRRIGITQFKPMENLLKMKIGRTVIWCDACLYDHQFQICNWSCDCSCPEFLLNVLQNVPLVDSTHPPRELLIWFDLFSTFKTIKPYNDKFKNKT